MAMVEVMRKVGFGIYIKGRMVTFVGHLSTGVMDREESRMIAKFLM